MKQDAKFTYGNDPESVKLNNEEVAKTKGLLKFEPKSEYYLRIPSKQFLPLVLFCLTAKTDTLTKKTKGIAQKIKAFWPTLVSDFLAHNQKRATFIAPYQLEILSPTVQYHFKLFQSCAKQFEMNNVMHTLNIFKQKYKVNVNNLAQNKPLGEKIQENVGQTIYLVQDRDEIVLCAFSPQVKVVAKHERKSYGSLQQNQKLPRKISEKTEPSKHPLRKVNEEEQPFVMQQQFNMEESLKKDEQKKYHFTFTIVLVFILVVFIICAFQELPAWFYQGVHYKSKPILEELIERLDSINNVLFG